MKKIIIAALAVISLTTACSDEEETLFTDYDKNWFVLDDTPADPAQHAACVFYRDFGVPVFYNATIGSQQRVDLWGNTYTHYETLTLSYAMGGNLTSFADPSITNYTLCDKSCGPTALQWLREEVMPSIPEKAHIHSIFLVESLYSMAHGTYAFRGVNTIVIGHASRLGSMSASEAKTCKGAILRAALTDLLFNKGLFDSQISLFGKITTDQDESAYNLYTGGKWQQDAQGNWYQVKPDIYALGFIGVSPSNSYYTPADLQADFLMYLEKLLTTEESEFDATLSTDGKPFGNYAAIMQKKKIVLDILASLGL